jgi:hypothetical protein
VQNSFFVYSWPQLASIHTYAAQASQRGRCGHKEISPQTIRFLYPINHHTAQTRTAHQKSCLPAEVCIGDLVYLHRDRDKVHPRDRYLVVSVDGTWCNIRKFVGNQLRNTSYRVKRSECYKVPSHITSHQGVYQQQDTSSDEEEEAKIVPKPPKPTTLLQPMSLVPPMVPIELDIAPTNLGQQCTHDLCERTPENQTSSLRWSNRTR